MKISVYITSYNQKEFLKEAIDSVLNQTLQPFEVIILDDCSTDGSRNLIKNYYNEYPGLVRMHFNTENLGITKTRNIALSLIKGDYLTWLDGDDVYMPNKLELEAQLLKKTNSNLVYSNFYYSKDKIHDIYQIWCSNTQELPKDKNVFKEVVSRNFPRKTLFRYELINTDLLRETGGYDENLEIYEDFDFRIRLSEIAKTAYNIQPLSVYRIHDNGLSCANKQVHKNNLNYILKKNNHKILNIDEDQQVIVRNKISNYMNLFNESEKIELSIKNRIKTKLVRIIKSL